MRKIVKIFVVAIIATMCFTACGGDIYSVDAPYASYNVVGKIIDKETKEPVKDVIVVLYLDLFTPRYNVLKVFPNANSWSNANGEFQVYENFTLDLVKTKNDSLSVSFTRWYDEGVSYKDTIIWADFKNAVFENSEYKNYVGNYILDMGEIELERIN